MSVGSTTLTTCPEIQDNLRNYFTSCDKTKLLPMHETSFVQYLVSNVNTDGTLQTQVAPGRGKRRTVELVYTPRIGVSEFSSTPAKVCVSTNKPSDCVETYQIIDVGLQYDEVWDLLDLRDICEDNELWVAERIARIMNGAIRKMDVDTMQDLTVLTGNFGAGETGVAAQVKTVASQKANGDPDPNFFVEIGFAGENAGYCSVPYVFGYDETSKTYKRAAAGCCADSGINLSEISMKEPTVFSPNSNVPTQFGANRFVTIDAGAVQLLFWNEFMGPKGINELDDGDHYKQTVLFHPLTGIPFDFQWSNNCGVISINIKLAYQLVGMPDDMFPAADHHDGVVGVNEFLISNP